MKTFLLILLPIFVQAQTVVTKRGEHRLLFDNSGFFKENKPKGFFDWKDYGETWDGAQLTTWLAFAGAGFMWGCREAYHADPYVFEKRWGAGETSWWGSEMWKRNYYGNNPDNGHKPEHFGNFGRDMWHTFGAGSKIIMVGGTFAIGARKQPAKFKIVNTLIGYAIQSAVATATYKSLRQ